MKVSADILHLTESITRLGGVETLVRQLVSHDEGSHAAALLDGMPTGLEKGWGLRANRLAGAAMVRRAAGSRFSRADHLVFHNFAGMAMLSGSIPHDRRCLFLHTNSDDIFALLPKRLPYLDSILVCGNELEKELHERFPDMRVPVTAVETPLGDCFFEPHTRVKGDGVLVGYSGRLEIEQKQVMRLVDLCRHLTALGVDFHLEIAGSGSAEEDLRRQLPRDRCQFIGVLDAGKLSEAYTKWDFLICSSDYETGPLVAMEAMATGAIPMMPDIPCQASRLLEVTGIPPYVRGDMLDAATRIRDLSNSPHLDELRQNLRNQVSGRRVDRFVDRIKSTLAESANRTALGKPLPVPQGMSEFLPFALRRSGNEYLR